jgi:hypothetical protein
MITRRTDGLALVSLTSMRVKARAAQLDVPTSDAAMP